MNSKNNEENEYVILGLPVQNPPWDVIPLITLADKGLLFEINRKVLHPLGLELALEYDNNLKKVTGVKLHQTYDPEGFLYPEDSFTKEGRGLDKFNKSGLQEKLEIRKKALGYIVQEPPKDK